MVNLKYRYHTYVGHRSSWVSELRHNGMDRLYFTTGDSTYVYDAPYAVYVNLVNASSVGSYYTHYVKGRCPLISVYENYDVKFIPVPEDEEKSEGDFAKTAEDVRALKSFVVTVRVEAEDGRKALALLPDEAELVSLVNE